MICLTGDVHHMSLRINDQRFIPDSGDTEVKIAGRYVELLDKYGVKATLYVCGKCFTEEWDDLKRVVSSEMVEIGGHQYRARQPRPWFDWYGAMTGNWNGPRWYQSWDIRKTVEVCERKTGYRIVSWRNHSYMRDKHTPELLTRYGIRLISDQIRSSQLLPEVVDRGLVSHPLNVIPDHDHLYHAHRTREFVIAANARGYGADEFGATSYTIEQWGDLVLEQVAKIERQGGVATILAHPLCMFLSDRFATFTRLLKDLAGRQCVWARELTSELKESGRRSWSIWKR